MRLALFSHGISNKAAKKLAGWVEKESKDVRLLYITTPINPKPKKPDWCIETENQLREIFPLTKEFDVEEHFKKNFNFKKFFKNQDIVFISGGNAYYLSYWMKKVGAETPLRSLVKKGSLIYAGESAGAVYLVDDFEPFGILDKPELAPKVYTEGLGLINFAPLPHWNTEKYRSGLETLDKFFKKRRVRTQKINDGDALFVEDGKIININ